MVRKVAITGASGFVGARTAEQLVRRGDVAVQAVVRAHGRLARLSPLPQERLSFAVADIGDADALAAAFAGCDAVVHCAFGSSGSVADRWHASVVGTAQVLVAARRAGVQRLVHLSTVEVYDCASEIIDETTAALAEVAEDREYEQQKLAAERLVLADSEPGLERVILQPAILYGPWAGQWTVAQIERLPADTGALPTGDHGHCAALYIDDLVTAIEAALHVPGIDGERFVLAGAEQVSWGRFFDAYRTMHGLTPPLVPAGAIEAWEMELYDRPGRVLSAKAERMLGWRGETRLDDGMAMVRDWASWMGYLGQQR